MKPFLSRYVYERRAEIVGSINICFQKGEWLNLVYYDFVDQRQKVNDEVLDWCDANLSSPYTFGKMSLQAITTEDWHAYFTSENDMAFFNFFWLCRPKV